MFALWCLLLLVMSQFVEKIEEKHRRSEYLPVNSFLFVYLFVCLFVCLFVYFFFLSPNLMTCGQYREKLEVDYIMHL